MDNKQVNLTEFFHEMAEMVKPFRSHVNLKDANVNGCRVLGAGARYWSGQFKKKVKKNHFLFSFLAKGDQLVDIEIDILAMALKPVEYANNIVEGINSALKEMQKENRIIVVQKKPLAIAKQLPSLH